MRCRFSYNQDQYANAIKLNVNDSRESILKKAAYVVPTKRQLKWQLKELTAFIHFGMNTFTDREWGDGREDPSLFNPIGLDVNQWVTVLKEAGFKQIIITAKHHDGFCLWPSAFTTHSVKYSSWKNGQGDLIKELADECVKQKMDLGVYLSPWDMHEKTYGTQSYTSFFKSQLRELLTNYGEITEVWFDGAVGPGYEGKQIYDWKSYYELIRTLQPDATIAIAGPDVRWVGTESGYGRDTEWSVVPLDDTMGLSENTDNILRPELDATQEELGTINQLVNAKAIKWYPSEVDVSLRPGWFYHASQDNEVKSPEKLLDIYFNSIGKNSSLVLNVSPDKNGLIPEKDATILKVFHNTLNLIFENNLAEESTITGSEFNIQHRAKSVLDRKFKTYWNPDASVAPYLIFEWDEPVWFNILSIQEQIEFGQRVSNFQLEIFENDAWVTKVSGTTIGYKRILRFPYIKTKKARLIFSENRDKPYVSEVGFYQDIPTVTIKPKGKPFTDSILVTMQTNSPEATIRYSQNFTTPSSSTNLYGEPLKLVSSSPLFAIAIDKNGQEGFIANEFYAKAKYKVTLLTTPEPEYLHEGGIVLCDGVKGDENFRTDKWIGYKNENLEVIFDLGTPKDIRNITIYSMIDTVNKIQPPSLISISSSISNDAEFQVKALKVPEVINTRKLQSYVISDLKYIARFLKISISHAEKSLPGAETFLFVSEIDIQ